MDGKASTSPSPAKRSGESKKQKQKEKKNSQKRALRKRQNLNHSLQMYHDKHKHEHSPKLKKRCLVSASRLAEMLQPTPNLRNAAYLSVHKTAGPSNQTESMNVQSHTSTPPRSTRNRTNSINLEDYEIDNIDTEDADLMRRTYRLATIKVENNPSLDEQSSPMQEKRTRDTISLPRREGLRPRKSTIRHSSQDFED
ncbi:hypothetical protein SUGI_0167960 [Cryptomeria japonica]|nr:hypothetical protein SUGI_0167960 [Cryptomeria japonica]